MGDEGCNERLSRCKTIEHGTEMSETTMDLMIKYNAYYIPTLQQEALWRESAYPNYYPAIVVP
jgi:hypothetical protein